MGFLLHIPDHLDIHVTEAVLGPARRPPGEGWNVAAVIEPSSGPPRFVWTRSKIFERNPIPPEAGKDEKS